MLSVLGPVMWALFAGELAVKSIGTDYGRVVRAMYTLAQVQHVLVCSYCLKGFALVSARVYADCRIAISTCICWLPHCGVPSMSSWSSAGAHGEHIRLVKPTERCLNNVHSLVAIAFMGLRECRVCSLVAHQVCGLYWGIH